KARNLVWPWSRRLAARVSERTWDRAAGCPPSTAGGTPAATGVPPDARRSCLWDRRGKAPSRSRTSQRFGSGGDCLNLSGFAAVFGRFYNGHVAEDDGEVACACAATTWIEARKRNADKPALDRVCPRLF